MPERMPQAIASKHRNALVWHTSPLETQLTRNPGMLPFAIGVGRFQSVPTPTLHLVDPAEQLSSINSGSESHSSNSRFFFLTRIAKSTR